MVDCVYYEEMNIDGNIIGRLGLYLIGITTIAYGISLIIKC